jgi:hypothetical protein
MQAQPPARVNDERPFASGQAGHERAASKRIAPTLAELLAMLRSALVEAKD